MSARDDILAGLRQTDDGTVGDLTPEALLDDYRAEILTEAKVETVGWLVKKAREYRSTGGHQHALQADAIETLASKVDRGAVRAFLGTEHYRDVMDAHRAEVLAEAAVPGEAYPGELAMLHGLIATLTAVAEHGDLTQVRKLLEEHQADTAAARAETKPTTAGPTGRRVVSHTAAAAALKAQPGVWLPIGEYRNRLSADDIARRIRTGYPLGTHSYGTPYKPVGAFEARTRITDDGTLLEARYTPKDGQP